MGRVVEEEENIPSSLPRALVTAPEHPPHDMAMFILMCWTSAVVGAASEDMIALGIGIDGGVLFDIFEEYGSVS